MTDKLVKWIVGIFGTTASGMFGKYLIIFYWEVMRGSYEGKL